MAIHGACFERDDLAAACEGVRDDFYDGGILQTGDASESNNAFNVDAPNGAQKEKGL